MNKNQKKYCIICSNIIDESELVDHILCCSISSTHNEPEINLHKSSFSMVIFSLFYF